jgi:hypothetical protein
MVDRPKIAISALQVAQRAGIAQSALLSREDGRQFLATLELVLEEHRDKTVVLHFDGIPLLTASFADSVFGTLSARRSAQRKPQTCLILQSVPQSHLDEIGMALLSRPEREAKVRNCLIPVKGSDHNVRLVGKAEGHVAHTFDLLRLRQQLTARDLADALELEIGAASTRLKVLVDLGLGYRTEVRDASGKQFVYVWPF